MKTWALLLLLTTAALKQVTCTDIAAVYKHSILLIRNAESISESQPLSWEAAELDLPKALEYPIGIASDSHNGRLFVADAMNVENSLFTVQMFSNGSIDAVYPLLKKSHVRDIRVIEDIFYDGRTSQLYWTDPYRNSLDKAHIPENPQAMIRETPTPVHNFGNVKKPRGAALDYCKNLLYWTEINDTGRQIEVCDLNGNYQGAVRSAAENDDKYFMGITYDISSGSVIWGEMEGKERGKPCKILSSQFGTSSDRESTITQLAELDNCYPFELSSDEEYVYWADWSRGGIMRLSKTNPDEIVKIVDAPQVTSEAGTHHGVFGLTILGGPSFQEIEKTCSNHQTSREVQEVNDNSDMQQTEQSVETETEENVNPTLEIVKQNPENLNPESPKVTNDFVTKTSTEMHSQLKEQLVTDELIKPQKKFLVQPLNSHENSMQKEDDASLKEKKDSESRSLTALNQGSGIAFDEAQDYQASKTASDENIEMLMLEKSEGNIITSFSPKKLIGFTLVALPAFYACFYEYL